MQSPPLWGNSSSHTRMTPNNPTATVFRDRIGVDALAWRGKVHRRQDSVRESGEVAGPSIARLNAMAAIPALLTSNRPANGLTPCESFEFQESCGTRSGLRTDAALGVGISLADGFAAATAVYGKAFNPLVTLNALTYFKDGNLPSLSTGIQDRLLSAATMIKLERLPQITPKPGISGSK